MTLPRFAPSNLAGLEVSGTLPAESLAEVHDGLMRDLAHPLAARSFRALRAGMAAAGWTLGFTDAYRPLRDQERLFISRHVVSPVATRLRWRGQWWRRKPGVAAAATPGNSDHGWGLSFDLCLIVNGRKVALAGDRAALAWMRANAGRFGFVEDVPDEPWHWTYQAGDTVPAAVLAFERPLPDPATRPTTFEEEDVRLIDVQVVCDHEGKGEQVAWVLPEDVVAVSPASTAFGGVPRVAWRPDVRATDGGRQIVVAVRDWFPATADNPHPIATVRVAARGS